MAKKKLIETHGKDESSTQPSSLDQIFGMNNFSRYGTLDESVYADKIKGLNRPELERHARSLGIVVVESTARLQEACMKEFRGYVSSLNKPKINVISKKPVSEAVQRVLNEGK